MEYAGALLHVFGWMCCHLWSYLCDRKKDSTECAGLRSRSHNVVCPLYVDTWLEKGAVTDATTGGCIHLFFEGYFAYNFRNMGGMQDLFGQLWKEYSLSDSRYLTQDAFVLCMETITAVSKRLAKYIHID